MRLEIILEQLHGIKKYHNLTWPELIKQLNTDYGIVFLDCGEWGQVFMHPSWDYIVKVFDTDDAYLTFVDYVINNPNIHFPNFVRRPMQIHMFHKRSSNIINKKFYVVKVEKLLPINTTYKLLINLDVIDDLTKALAKNKTTCLLPDIDSGKGILSLGKMTFSEQNIKEFFAKMNDKNLETLIPVILQLRRSMIGKNFRWDLHGNNVMMRKDGTVVITDPFSGQTLKTPFFDYHDNYTISGTDITRITRTIS